jgi:hypothetical protein
MIWAFFVDAAMSEHGAVSLLFFKAWGPISPKGQIHIPSPSGRGAGVRAMRSAVTCHQHQKLPGSLTPTLSQRARESLVKRVEGKINPILIIKGVRGSLSVCGDALRR